MDAATIYQALESLSIETSHLRGHSKLGHDAGMDSQEIVELTCALEQRLKVSLDDEQIDRHMSIDELCALIGSIRAAA